MQTSVGLFKEGKRLQEGLLNDFFAVRFGRLSIHTHYHHHVLFFLVVLMKLPQ